MTLSDKITESNFAKQLIGVTADITSSHVKLSLQNRSLNYDELGTDNEKLIKKTFNYYYNLTVSVKDLEMVIAFLEIEDRNKIRKVYPKIEKQKDYYNYHVENFIIRIISIADIIGKIGHVVFQTGIEDKRCNGYTFKDKIKNTVALLSSKIEALLEHTKSIKEKRHKMLHEGDKDFTYFYSVVVFEDFTRDMDSDEAILRKGLTEEALKREIKTIKKEINNSVDMIVEILELMSGKLVETIKAL